MRLAGPGFRDQRIMGSTMRESLAEMMERLEEDMPGHKWINTSVGTVNTNNKNAMALASIRLMKAKQAKQKREENKETDS